MAGVGLHQVFQYQPTWLTWHSWPYPTQKVHSSNLQYVYTYLVVILLTVNFLQQIKTKQIEARNGPFNENNLNILPLLAIGDKTTWDWFRIMETCPKVFNIVFNRAQHTHHTPSMVRGYCRLSLLLSTSHLLRLSICYLPPYVCLQFRPPSVVFHHYISLGSGKLVLFFFVKLVLNAFCRSPIPLLHVSNSFDLKSDFDFWHGFEYSKVATIV